MEECSFSDTFYFGYDLSNILEVMQHVENNYTNDEYKMCIGRGDDVMNTLYITPHLDDTMLHGLIACCEKVVD